ncbi:unnamed protein product [Cuscuta epithymum]|uniref:Uncharacterized protein n=1 Tax=Cuscuta epithymum TaxID=186058 RepID=A0AAV0FW24_9ASTE|nr:unnamed protein product [Cuscuta epithymum]
MEGINSMEVEMNVVESEMEGRNDSIEEEGEGLIRSNNVEVDPGTLVIQVIQSKLMGLPKLLTQSGRVRFQSCIFRVPQQLLGTNSEADARPYQPRAFSIGPYHHGKPHLKEMQEYKLRFLKRLIQRTMKKKGVGLAQYVDAVKGLEEEARDLYSEFIHLSSAEFVEMLVLDGCFVVEILRASKPGYFKLDESDNPLLSITQFILRNCHHDLYCLENQIPYIVLQTLFTLTETEDDDCYTFPAGCLDSLANLAIDFFRGIEDGEEVDAEELQRDYRDQHLLNLLRKNYSLPVVPPGKATRASCLPRQTNTWDIKSISKLRRAGIKLKAQDVMRSLVDVRFERGVIWMPLLVLDDKMCDILLNCVAFEICAESFKRDGRVMSDYAWFLFCLIKTDEDVAILCEAEVLQNHLGMAGEVTAFVARLGMAALSNNGGCRTDYFRELYGDVNIYYDNNVHIYLAEGKHKYFSSPWSLISLLAAIFLLLLTVLQTIVAILDLKKKS